MCADEGAFFKKFPPQKNLPRSAFAKKRNAMPELPEVETIARTLEPLIAGGRIEAFSLLLPRTVDASGGGSLPLDLLVGRTISAVRRRGKLALICLEPLENQTENTPHMLAVHLKMTGRLFVYDQAYPPQKHTRLVLQLAQQNIEDEGAEGEGNTAKVLKVCKRWQKQLFFDDARTFGYVRVVSPASLRAWPFWQGLGLEPLKHSARDLATIYVGKKAGMKSLLLNQGLVVGIGNIYADEALFRARIAPQRKADTLSLQQLTALMQAVQDVLRLSIEQCGSSIRDYRDAHGDAGSFQNTFFVYGRSGAACKACGHALTTAKVAGRTTVYCEKCQL